MRTWIKIKEAADHPNFWLFFLGRAQISRYFSEIKLKTLFNVAFEVAPAAELATSNSGRRAAFDESVLSLVLCVDMHS